MPSTTRFIRKAQMPAYDVWDKLSPRLQGMDIRLLYISPDGQLTHLAGPDEGREGVHLASVLQGDYHWPFDQVITEGAYQLGATIERTNVNKRVINFGVMIGGGHPPMSHYQYHMAEDRWWNGQDPDRDGWLGQYTRFSGWRWIRVRPAKTVDTALKQSPVAYGNNFAQWDVNWVCQTPYYTKPALFKTWKAADALVDDDRDPVAGEGIITLANRGDLESHVKYLVSSPGQAIVQDNYSNRYITLPELVKTDGTVLVDTDPTQRTLTSSTDPVDNLFYKIIRSSKILDFFLHDLEQTGLPVWQRFDSRFTFTVPPKTVVSLRVKHSNPNGIITAILPQRYRRGR